MALIGPVSSSVNVTTSGNTSAIITNGTNNANVTSTSYGYGLLTYAQAEMIKTGVGLPAGTVGQALVNATVEAGATGATVYTVTAGKTFYVSGVTLTCNLASGAALIKLTVSGVTKYIAQVDTTENHSAGSMTPIFTVPASTALILSHNGGGSTVHVTVWGWEQ